MTRRIPVFLMVVAFALILGSAREAYGAGSCSECRSICEYDCFQRNSTCFQATASCDGGGGGGWCDWQCTNGQYHYTACGCPSGSPIFRKFPVNPASTRTGETKDSRQGQPAEWSSQPSPALRAVPCP